MKTTNQPGKNEVSWNLTKTKGISVSLLKKKTMQIPNRWSYSILSLFLHISWAIQLYVQIETITRFKGIPLWSSKIVKFCICLESLGLLSPWNAFRNWKNGIFVGIDHFLQACPSGNWKTHLLLQNSSWDREGVRWSQKDI